MAETGYSPITSNPCPVMKSSNLEVLPLFALSDFLTIVFETGTIGPGLLSGVQGIVSLEFSNNGKLSVTTAGGTTCSPGPDDRGSLGFLL